VYFPIQVAIAKKLAKSMTIPSPIKNAALYSVWFTVTDSNLACQFFVPVSSCRVGQFQLVISWLTRISIRKTAIRQSTQSKKSQWPNILFTVSLIGAPQVLYVLLITVKSS
jgi:hypothetical protein